MPELYMFVVVGALAGCFGGMFGASLRRQYVLDSASEYELECALTKLRTILRIEREVKMEIDKIGKGKLEP